MLGRWTILVAFAAAAALAAGGGAADAAPAPTPSPHVETAGPFIPPGTFRVQVRRWTAQSLRQRFARSRVDAAPDDALVLGLPRKFGPIPNLDLLPPGPTRLEEFGAGLGDRLAKRLRLRLEREADEQDLFREIKVKDRRRELLAELCGIAATWGADALADGSLNRDDLSGLVGRAREVSFRYALLGDWRSRYAEAAYLGLTAADYAEELREVANEPDSYLRDRLGSPVSPAAMQEALVGAACSRAMRASGLRAPQVTAGGLFPTLSFVVPAVHAPWFEPPRAVTHGLSCTPYGTATFKPERCTWIRPFAS